MPLARLLLRRSQLPMDRHACGVPGPRPVGGLLDLRGAKMVRAASGKRLQIRSSVGFKTSSISECGSQMIGGFAVGNGPRGL
jgi:hypothetical protein